jgi:DNA (cytosine-5)-methyltransferase 1
MTEFTAIDLFSGAGGLSLGLREAGFKLAASLENDEQAAKTYLENIGPHLIVKPVEQVSVEEIASFAGLERGECTLLAGGPPCQGFSLQRRGSREDARNGLILEFIRFVEGLQPRFFLIENVSGLMTKHGRPFFRAVIERTAAIGYDCSMKKLNAVHYGVPQVRVRSFLIGERLDIGQAPHFRFPTPNLDESQWLTVGDAIGNLPSPPEDGAPHPDIPNHYREARLSPINLERIRHVPPGGGREHLPPHLQLACHQNNPTHRHLDVYGRLAWDKPSGTITARFDSFTRGRFGHPEEHRSLTIREGARLQTFPDSFVFFGSREETARQIGNAVPPRLAQKLGEAFISACQAPREYEAETVSGSEQLSLLY